MASASRRHALVLPLVGSALAAAALTLSAAAARGQGNELERALASATESARRVAPALGVHVLDLGSGATVWAWEPDRPRIVASNTKLITSAAALSRLGPGHLLETPLLTRGEVDGETLDGDLAVIGGGDPLISGRRTGGDSLALFREWGTALRELGIRRIAGDLVLVHGAFDDLVVHPDWPRDQLDAWYEAPVEALSFSDNCVLVRVSPGPRPGTPAHVEVLPDVGAVEVSSSARTVAGRPRSRATIHRSPGSDVVVVRGEQSMAEGPLEAWITVGDPVAYFGAAVRAGLEQAGVRVEGATTPAPRLEETGWEPVAVHRSDLLSVLDVMNQRSQNLFAESVFKLLGHELCGEGSWPSGRSAVEEFLRVDLGLPDGSYSLADGSGMSRENRFTPRQLTTLLAHMFGHRWSREFLRTLPYSGQEDLRWERRLAEEPYRGNVFAKTGGLNGVSTLSGYAKARSGRLYAFSILCNETRSNGDAMRAQDAIVRALVDRG